MTDRFEKLTTGVSRIYKYRKSKSMKFMMVQTLINGEICLTLPSIPRLRNPMLVTCIVAEGV